MNTLTNSTSSDLTENLYVIFVRLLALCFVFFAIQYWMKLIGFYEGVEFQFDTMSVHWKIASAVLAVIQPVVALGLWGLFSWGMLVWLVAALIEIAMFSYFSDLFGENRTLIIFHSTCAALIAIFVVFTKVIGNKK